MCSTSNSVGTESKLRPFSRGLEMRHASGSVARCVPLVVRVLAPLSYPPLRHSIVLDHRLLNSLVARVHPFRSHKLKRVVDGDDMIQMKLINAATLDFRRRKRKAVARKIFTANQREMKEVRIAGLRDSSRQRLRRGRGDKQYANLAWRCGAPGDGSS